MPFRPRERCYPGGVPGFVVYTLVEPFYFLQTDKEVTIINTGGTEIRRVHIERSAFQESHATPHGTAESVGHYENGDTPSLWTRSVLSTKTFVDNYRTPHTDQLHVVERFKLSGDGKALEDLIALSKIRTLSRRSGRQCSVSGRVEDRPLHEEACAENNSDYFNFDVVPLPQADKPDF